MDVTRNMDISLNLIWCYAEWVYVDDTVYLFHLQDKDMIDPFPLPLVIVGTKYDIFQVWLKQTLTNPTTNTFLSKPC